VVNALETEVGGEGGTVSKGQDRKKEQRKKPAKTLDEKRTAKRLKKAERGTRSLI
jgi:hypothetical protein